MLLKQHEKTIKMAITGTVLVVAIVVIGMEIKAQHEFNVLAAQQDADFERNKPFYDCIIAAEAMVSESPSGEEVLAANEAIGECYERYNKQR